MRQNTAQLLNRLMRQRRWRRSNLLLSFVEFSSEPLGASRSLQIFGHFVLFSVLQHSTKMRHLSFVRAVLFRSASVLALTSDCRDAGPLRCSPLFSTAWRHLLRSSPSDAALRYNRTQSSDSSYLRGCSAA